MAIPVTCQCSRSFKVNAALAGKHVACPSCRAAVKIPDSSASGTVTIRCGCEKVLRVKAELAGKTVKCPSCSSGLQIPSSTSSEPIPVHCNCGRSFNAKPAMAGKRAACPACGNALQIPTSRAEAKQASPASRAAPKNSSAFPQNDPLASVDPLAGNFADYSNFPATAAPAAYYSPQSYGVPKKRKSSSRKLDRRLVKGLAIGGVSVVGVALIAMTAIFAIPIVQKAISSAGNPTSSWILYQSWTGTFDVKLPKKPVMNMKQMPSPFGLVQVNISTADQGASGAYLVSHYLLPIPEGSPFDPNQVLDDAIQAMAQRSQGAITSQQSISVSGYPGREFSLDGNLSGRSCSLHTRYILVDKMCYELMWVGPRGRAPTAQIREFFDSFTLKTSAANAASPTITSAPNAFVPMQTNVPR